MWGFICAYVVATCGWCIYHVKNISDNPPKMQISFSNFVLFNTAKRHSNNPNIFIYKRFLLIYFTFYIWSFILRSNYLIQMSAKCLKSTYTRACACTHKSNQVTHLSQWIFVLYLLWLLLLFQNALKHSRWFAIVATFFFAFNFD